MGWDSVVLDCSVTLAWFLPPEFDEEIDNLKLDIAQGSTVAHAPRIWPYEVHNRLAKNMRTVLHHWKKLSAEEAEKQIDWAFECLSAIKVYLSGHPRGHFSDYTREFYHLHKENGGIDFFDAAYLALAIKKGIPIATLDTDLVRAAERYGVDSVFSQDKIEEWGKIKRKREHKLKS